MDNMIKKFNEELKYYFPESRLEAVLFEIPLSKIETSTRLKSRDSRTPRKGST